MLNLNVNVVMKNVHDVLPHMIERKTGDISSRAPGRPFSDALGAGLCVVEMGVRLLVEDVRRQVFKDGIRVGSISPGPVITALLADWPQEKLKELIGRREVCWRPAKWPT